ncbi:hypothetical protein C7M84_018261 [Penaeus vannamei]|uniref:RNA-directed DNA polymerase n=1 Tax=Penaeus vannamei TaxID=6689 RepID=A0A3R7NET5_PENVA|nr:hypothetical protein C7M84_018261 [Penaeus vannamei]
MNPVADALSRVEINSINLGIDYNEVAAAQKDDPETTEYHTAITSLQWKDVHIGGEGRTILCDVSTGRPRPLIPKSFRRKIFNLIHGLSHPSGRTTARLMKDKFIWHGMNKDIKQWARCCVACQMSKVSRHTESGTGEFRQPMRRFGHLHVDVVGPLPPSDGAQYLFTATERSTRWPEAIPMQHTTARDCAEALLHGWISRFGVPDDITSDRGPAFTSQLWTSLGELMGSTIHHTTSYNPEANGMVERFHRTLKAALMARCTKSDWKAQLPWVLLGIRTSPKEGLQVSPAEMVFGEALTVPGEFFPSLDTPTDSVGSLPFIQPVEWGIPLTIISRWTAAGPSSQLLSCGMILFSRFTPALEPRGFSRLLFSFLAGSRFRPERLQKPCTDKIFSEFGQAMACFHTPIDSVPELRSVYALSP